MSKPFVFISYTHAQPDADYVERLVDRLRANGVNTWFDRELPQSEIIPRAIDARLDACAAIIVVMTPSAAQSSWVAREISGARQRNKPIFPLLLAGDHFPNLKSTRGEVVTHGRMPDADWVAQVKRARSKPSSPMVRPKAIAWALAAVIAVAAAAGIFVAFGGPSATDVCGELPTRIENVPTTTAGHTGHNPTITITVCTEPGKDHEYWLANYTDDIEMAQSVARYFIKARVTASGSYPVVHSEGTPEESKRTYVIVEAPRSRSPELSERIVSHAPLSVAGDGSTPPANMRVASNTVPALL